MLNARTIKLCSFICALVPLMFAIKSVMADSFTVNVTASKPAPVLKDGDSLSENLKADLIDTTNGQETSHLTSANWTWTFGTTYSSTVSGNYGSLPSNSPNISWNPSNSPSPTTYQSSDTSDPTSAVMSISTQDSSPRTTGGYYNIAVHVHVDFTDKNLGSGSADGNITIQMTVIQLDIVGSNGILTNTTQNAVVGQHIIVYAQVAPSDIISLNGTTGTWTIPGKKVSSYTWSNQAGTVIPFLNYTGYQESFYWIDGSTRVVSYAVTVAGLSCTESTTYNVLAPNPQVQNQTPAGSPGLGVVAIDKNFLDGSAYYLHDGSLPIAPYNNAGTFGVTYTITYPTNSTVHGEYGWAQITSGVTRTVTRLNGGKFTYIIPSYPTLDGNFPTGLVSVDANRDQWFDSPGVHYHPFYDSNNVEYSDVTEVLVNEAFQSYLMFRPDDPNNPNQTLPDSIWVPLGTTSWSWTGHATNGKTDASGNFTWTKDYLTNPAPTAYTAQVPFPYCPTWNSQAQSGKYVSQ